LKIGFASIFQAAKVVETGLKRRAGRENVEKAVQYCIKQKNPA
jgi:hypothetical protein